ncbi:MAG: hypothetical protein HFH24_02205 [Ruminococcus sp.]|nr:hypothetical protein [Ruminococcus sp.]
MATVTMSGLVSKYENFLVPAVKVKAAGREVTGGDTYVVEAVEVTLSKEASSAASIKLTNVYDPESRRFFREISSDFILGELVEVEMGYGSRLSSLFYGYIEEINYELEENPSVHIMAMDVRRLMMGSKKSNIAHKVTSYSDAFQEVVKKYKAAYKKTSVDKTEKMDVECIIQNGNDYKFITEELCKKGERDFFVHAGTLYYKKLSEEIFQTVELEWARDLLSFQRRASFQDTVIKILGQDLKKKEEVEAQVKLKADDKQKSLVQNELTEMNADIQSSGDARKVAEYKAEQEKKKTRQASGVCVGIPEILPGGYVKIKNADAGLLDGVYAVAEVKHTFGADGYRTSFDLGGWKR